VVAVSEVGVSRRLASWSPSRVEFEQGLVPVRTGVERAGAVPRVRLPASTYRRRRAVAAGLVVVLLLAVSAALGMLGGGPLAAPERPNPSASRLPSGPTYVVQPGDTFWGIAHRLRPDADPRPLVDRLVALHGGSTLYVGERIPLPAR